MRATAMRFKSAVSAKHTSVPKGDEVVVQDDLHAAADEHGDDGNADAAVRLQDRIGDEHEADEDAGDAEHREQRAAELGVVAAIEKAEERIAQRPEAEAHREGEQRRDAQGRAHDAGGLPAVALRDGGGDGGDDRGGERDHERGGQVVKVHAGGVVAVGGAHLVERVAEGVLQSALDELGVDEGDEGDHRGRECDGDGEGEEAAKAYMVAAGNSVLLMDSEKHSFYIKSTDQSGMPMPLRIFDYTERTAQPQKKTEEYATREELKALEERISALMEGKNDEQ